MIMNRAILLRKMAQRMRTSHTGAGLAMLTGGASALYLWESGEGEHSQTQQHPTILATSSGGLVHSFLSRITPRSTNNDRKPGLVRQSTLELLHKTANLKPIDLNYNTNWEEPIGQGTFGNVYQVIHRKTGERVAIKKI